MSNNFFQTFSEFSLHRKGLFSVVNDTLNIQFWYITLENNPLISNNMKKKMRTKIKYQKYVYNNIKRFN